MNIVIDGYNMIKQGLKKPTITDAERANVLARLDAYARQKQHTIHIIFDGGPYDRPTKERFRSLTVIYSGRRQSADDVIKTYIEEKVLPAMLIVTTDRNLNAFAYAHSVASIDSIDFYAFLYEKPLKTIGFKKTPGKALKFERSEGSSEKESSELDALMQEGSTVLLYKDEQEEGNQREIKKRSKQEKLAQKLVNKL
ncbi:NYN domain-containing protein [Candidatus Dependentiae bacterium]|nr:NYN domain-containing protein [Candidatus Dependentiae bacterium]